MTMRCNSNTSRDTTMAVCATNYKHDSALCLTRRFSVNALVSALVASKQETSHMHTCEANTATTRCAAAGGAQADVLIIDLHDLALLQCVVTAHAASREDILYNITLRLQKSGRATAAQPG